MADGEKITDEKAYPLVGETLDRYRLIAPIGEGAMGCVYRATHTVLPREYAIKVLFRDFASNATQIERFRREAQAASTMTHQNIVSVADFVALPNGLTFIVMELVAGRTLERAIQSEAPFSPLRVANIAKQVAAGLGEAHRMGFVHRDVKPSNIMLGQGPKGEAVKILDFGVVGIGSVPLAARLTGIGHIIGTPTYMAPEQVHDPGVGPPADLYALGVIMFEMLAGEPPFTGVDRTEVFIKHISEPPPLLPPSDGLEMLVAWLLEKQPDKRPKRADEVIRAIDRLAIGEMRPDMAETGDITLRPPTPKKAMKEEAPKARTDDRAKDDRTRSSVMAVTNEPRVPSKSKLAERPPVRQDNPLDQDTDSEIPGEEIKRELADTDPERLAKDQTGPKKLPSGDDPFKSLAHGANASGEWSSWDPDGSYASLKPIEHHDTMPVPARDQPLTDPVVRARSPNESDEKVGAVPPTQIVRARGRPPVVTEDVPRSFDPPTDLMYYEPELPNAEGSRTRPNAVDEGPTVVDFDMNAAVAAEHGSPYVTDHGATLPIPIVLPDSAPTEATIAPNVGPTIQKMPSDEALDLRHVATVLDTDTIDEPSDAIDGIDGVIGTEGFIDDDRPEGTERIEGFEHYVESIPPILAHSEDDVSQPLVKPLRAPEIPAMDEDFDRAMEGLRQAAESQAATAQDLAGPQYSSKTRTDVALQPSPVRSSQELDAGFLDRRITPIVIGLSFLLVVAVAFVIYLLGP